MSYLIASSLGHQIVSKNFLFTLGLGVTFGFSFAYMLLSAGGVGRKELFLGPPYRPDVEMAADPHDHKVRVVELTDGRTGTSVCLAQVGEMRRHLCDEQDTKSTS